MKSFFSSSGSPATVHRLSVPSSTPDTKVKVCRVDFKPAAGSSPSFLNSRAMYAAAFSAPAVPASLPASSSEAKYWIWRRSSGVEMTELPFPFSLRRERITATVSQVLARRRAETRTSRFARGLFIFRKLSPCSVGRGRYLYLGRITRLQPTHMEPSVHVKDLTRREWEGTLDDGTDRFGDVFWLSPTWNRGQPVRNQSVVLLFDACRHIRFNDSRSNLEDRNSKLCQSVRV